MKIRGEGRCENDLRGWWRHLALWAMLFAGPAVVAQAADPRPAEAGWAAILAKAQGDDETLWLEPPDDRALALLRTPGRRPAKGAAILLPPMGSHPDWPAVISPLRTRLPDYGWTTLSIQLPALRADAGVGEYVPLFPAARARIAAAVDLLQQRGAHNIVLVGYGLGALMGADFLAEQGGTAGVTALVAVSMVSYPDLDPGLNAAKLIEKVPVPILDIYASRDLDAVLDFNTARTRAARIAAAAAAASDNVDAYLDSTTAQPGMYGTPGHIAYRQISLVGTDHGYSGLEATLAKRLAGWMNHHARGAEKNALADPKQ